MSCERFGDSQNNFLAAHLTSANHLDWLHKRITNVCPNGPIAGDGYRSAKIGQLADGQNSSLGALGQYGWIGQVVVGEGGSIKIPIM